jgi:hypothetical protein
MLGLDNKQPIIVKGVMVARADVVAACCQTCSPGRLHVRQNQRRNMGEGNQGWQTPPGIYLPGG